LLAKSTQAERAVCVTLQRLGIPYVQQFPISTPKRLYYADIYIPIFRLVIEVDGAYHQGVTQKRLDCNRSANIRRMGYAVCRLSNRDAYSAESVKRKLRRYTSKRRKES